MSNISLGTHFSDGLRTGPIYDTDTAGNINSGGNLNIYGPGVLHSVQHSYNIKTSPANTAGGFTGLDNIVASVTNIPANTYLTLRGDGELKTFTLPNGTSFNQYVGCTFYRTGLNGLPLIQLDWPRVPTVTITGADLAGQTRVTIFGYDFYRLPMQHTYIVQNQGTYPSIKLGVDALHDNQITNFDGTALLPAKAFYQITGVHVNGAINGGASISIGASSKLVGNAALRDIFGLPYVIKGEIPALGFSSSCGVITSIQWALKAGVQPTDRLDPIDQRVIRTPGAPLGFAGAFVPADLTNPSTALTGDVRGLYSPSSPSDIQTDGAMAPAGPVIIDWTNLIFTAFIRGEDTWINQVANEQQEFSQSTGLAPQGATFSPLNAAEAYGVPQFFTGNPS